MTSTTEHIHAAILTRLRNVRRKRNKQKILSSALMTIAIAGGLSLVAICVEEAFFLPVLLRTIMIWALALTLGSLLLWRLFIPTLQLLHILRDEDDHSTAGWVGRAYPDIGDRIVNVLELYHDHEQSAYYSPVLIQAAFEDVENQIAPLDFTSAVSSGYTRRMGRLAAAFIGVATIALLLSPSAFLGSVYRLWHFGEAFAAPQAFSFVIKPGNKEVIRGETVTVTVRTDGASPEEILLRSKQAGESVFEEQGLKRNSDGIFLYTFNAVHATTTYTVSAGSVRSGEYALTVVDRPSITRLNLVLLPPAYTNLASTRLDDNVGDITGLAGTKSSVTIEASKDLARAELQFNDSSSLPLQIRGSRATGSFSLRRNGSYQVRLVDASGTANADPVEYVIHIVPDNPPTVSIVSPGKNLDVADNTTLDLLIKIGDDYGFSGLRLAYRLVQSRYEEPADHFSYSEIPLPGNAGVEALVPYAWALKTLRLVPEDMVSYYVEVVDNDRVNGPKSAVSETYTLRLPSFDEVVQDIDKNHDVTLEDMKKALSGADEMRKAMEDLQQALRQEQQKLDWQSQKKAEDLLKKFEDIHKSIDEANATVDKMLDEMQKNRVLSKETLEKYEELQHLMSELNSPELAEALKKLQESMQQLSPEAMKQALQQLSFSEENFRKSLDRTINMIKRLQIEAKVDELTKRTEDLQKQQEELRDRTQKANPRNQETMRDLDRRQQGTQEQLKQLEKDLSDLRKAMEQFPKDMPVAAMQNLEDSLAASGVDQQMSKIQADLAQQDMESAVQGQEQASSAMESMARQMRSMKQEMRRNQQQQIVNEMRRVTEDLLELSRREETLKNETENTESNAPRFRENAQAQMDVLRDLGNVTERMSGLSDKTFGVTPEMGKAAGDAMRQMQNALQALEQRNGAAAGQEQGSAMGSLNDAAQMMEQGMSGMMQSGGQGMMGLSGFLQRLRQLSEQQQGINQGTQGLGQMTPEQAEKMGRLAGEQGMVRKSLEELQREAAAAGQLSKMLGDLRSIAEEMKEVQTDLAQGTANPETVKKQERILSRLLESQRSLNERDYENRRRAETGKSHPGQSPVALDLSTQEGRTRLRQDLLKALKEGYARDYEELIRRYFEALQQQEQNKEH